MFVFKGISSEEMQVVVEEEEHFIARAAQRYERTEIEGRDGAIYDELGYSDVEKSIVVQCLNVEKIDDILSWLNGIGELEYNERTTMARFYSELVPERKACIRIIEASFIREPFWCKANDSYVIASDSVENEGNIGSRPIIRLEKNTDDSVELTIGNVRFQYDFLEEPYVEIDCEEKTAKYNGLNRSRQLTIGYNYPLLQKGDNIITTHSGDATIKIKRKDRWL